jgi:ribosomal protein S18 acetylase RimI-like enzyme
MIESRDVVVRAFTVGDAGDTAALIRTTLFTSNAADYTASELSSLADWYAAGPLISRMGLSERFVAVVGAERVGTAAHRDGQIEGFFVAPSWQRQGVGELLLAALEASARRRMIDRLLLHSSVTAVDFYLRQGFEPTGEPFDAGEGLVVPMSKDL